MTGIDLTEAVESGLAALRRDGCVADDCTGFVRENVYADGALQVALTAALPHLEKQIRKLVGDEIEAEFDRRSPIPIDAAFQYNSGVLDGLDIAEQIARTRKDT